MTGTCDKVRENTGGWKGDMCLVGDIGGEMVQDLVRTQSLFSFSALIESF